MRTTCLYCGGPLVAVYGFPHWRSCAAGCASKFDYVQTPGWTVVKHFPPIPQGHPGWARKT